MSDQLFNTCFSGDLWKSSHDPPAITFALTSLYTELEDMDMMALQCWDGNWDGHYGAGMGTGMGTIELGWMTWNWDGRHRTGLGTGNDALQLGWELGWTPWNCSSWRWWPVVICEIITSAVMPGIKGKGEKLCFRTLLHHFKAAKPAGR